MLEDDRKSIERKIYEFHRDHGDPRVPLEPFAHPGVCKVAVICGGLAQWIILAQNYEVMKSFQAV